MSVFWLTIIIVFVILSFAIWSCIIIYCIYQKCKPKTDRGENNHVEESSGSRYPAFDIQGDLSRVSERPFTVTERMEAPPSYEEAIKHDAFRGYSLCTTSDVIHETQRPNSNESSNFTEVLPENPVSPTYNQPTSSQEVPASTSGCSSYQAKSGASNNCASHPLTTISEEFDEYDATNQPLTVVIDSIGVRSARLLNDCDTSVQLPKTDELTSDSKC